MSTSRESPCIQSIPGRNVNILGGHSIGHSKKKTLYEHVSDFGRLLRSYDRLKLGIEGKDY